MDVNKDLVSLDDNVSSPKKCNELARAKSLLYYGIFENKSCLGENKHEKDEEKPADDC